MMFFARATSDQFHYIRFIFRNMKTIVKIRRKFRGILII